MTAITILPEKLGTVETRYRALAGERESVGRSVGEALDALTSQLSETKRSYEGSGLTLLTFAFPAALLPAPCSFQI